MRWGRERRADRPRANWPSWPISFEKRQQQSGAGDFSDQVLRLVEAQAAGTAADISRTAAVESAAGMLSRVFAAAEVEAAPWARQAVSRRFLSLVGRDLVRAGASLHLIDFAAGRLALQPVASWHWENQFDNARPDGWRVRATYYGPSTSTTKVVGWEQTVFMQWSYTAGTPYVGGSPIGNASTTARLQAETERSLGDEAAGPLANMIPYPADGGDGGEEDPLKGLKADIKAARGRALLVETTAAGLGDGRSAAPLKDWVPQRLGPAPPEPLVIAQKQTFAQMLAACGCPAALVDADAVGTTRREAYRQYVELTLEPLAALLADELSAKLETPIRLSFAQLYSRDMQGRAVSFKKMVEGGMPVEKAAALSGLLQEDA